MCLEKVKMNGKWDFQKFKCTGWWPDINWCEPEWIISYKLSRRPEFEIPVFFIILGSYLPGGYPFSPYGSKIAGGEEGSDKSRASPTVTKMATDSKALDILHQHASQYKSKSPTVGDKPLHDREREQDRGAGGDRERERERDMDRPRSSPSQRIMPSHHHLGYPLLSGQYDLSYATGQSDDWVHLIKTVLLLLQLHMQSK